MNSQCHHFFAFILFIPLIGAILRLSIVASALVPAYIKPGLWTPQNNFHLDA